MLRNYCLFSILAFSVSCEQVESLKVVLDNKSFSMTGGTLFLEPTLVTTKEIHFDAGRLLGATVLLSAAVEELGKHDTYIVVSDGSGRMLVVLTNLEDSGFVKNDLKEKKVEILGTVERGKKGLPYILARSVKLSTPD